MKAKGFWCIVVLFCLWCAALQLHHYQFLAKNAWYNEQPPLRGYEETVQRQEEVPPLVRGFVHMNVKNDVSFLEFGVGQYVSRAISAILVLLFVILLYLGIKQNRMAGEIRELRLRVEAGVT